MAPQPRLLVRVDGKILGYVTKSRVAWHFRPSEDTSLVQATNRQTLKLLGEDIKLAIGVKEIQFQEVPRPIKAASRKQSSRPKKRRKLTQEEWRALEREQAKLSPRPASMESSGKGTSRGRPVSGGLPGLGKRR